jgi:hypothetical protein
LVCPFSKNTFSTFAIGGIKISPKEKADGYKNKKRKKIQENGLKK